jgi:hypothetical protein
LRPVIHVLFALPPRLALCLYAQFGMTIAASKIKDWMKRACRSLSAARDL